jgi:FKBP-type peptidyl-prolyl cis-trans isomerase
MRRTLALALSAMLALPAFAQQGQTPPPGAPKTPPPAAPAGQPAGDQLQVQPVEPPKPAPVPVPDGPVVNRQELEGGLIVEDLKIGEGYTAKENAAVVAFYHGTLKESGKEFDSSFNRGEPVPFELNRVIVGWQKGVPGMKVGGIRRLTIPAALGYGERAVGDRIPANSDLVFVIQLVDVVAVEDVKEGTGEPIEGQFVAVTAHTAKDASGNVVEKHERTNPYIWIPREFAPIDSGLQGMKLGGVRKIHIPKEWNQGTQMSDPDRPTGVPLDFEIELVAMRNLRPPQPRQ